MAISQQDLDTAQKIKIENQLNTQLTKPYNAMIAGATLDYDDDNSSHPVSLYTTAIAGAIAIYYLQTITAFSKIVNNLITPETETYIQLEQIAALDPTGEATVDDVITGLNADANLINLAEMDNYVSAVADQIEKTNEKQLQAIVDENLSTDEFAKKLRSIYGTRIDTISQTTVQNAAESTKSNYLKSINNSIKLSLGQVVSKEKMWQTILDGREREAHNIADGQRQNVDNPFVVGGELLKFPGDTSLGASLGNIINCRCSMIMLL